MRPFCVKLTLLLFFGVVSFSVFSQKNSELELADEYFKNSEFEKAILYYDKVLNSKSVDPIQFYENYKISLEKIKQFESLQKFVKKISKENSAEFLYKVDYALTYKQLGNDSKSESEIQKLIQSVLVSQENVYKLTHAFSKRKLFDYAIQTYQDSRRLLSEDNLYALELASLYAYKKDVKKFVPECLKAVLNNDQNMELITVSLSNTLSTEADYEFFVNTVYEALPNHTNTTILNELLVWYYVQKLDFYNAFVEERAIDKKNPLMRGSRLDELAVLCKENKNNKQAIEIYSYLLKTYPSDILTFQRQKLLIEILEQEAKEAYPVSTESIHKIITQYDELLQKTVYIEQQAEIKKKQALLRAQYLNQQDTAIVILTEILKNPRLSREFIAETKIDLGDIYLLANEPWEASLLYSQAELLVEPSPLSNKAKFKNAKVSYYTGDFELAKEHLNILKLATSREIANDALDLALLIQDNVALDTSDAALKLYAHAELNEYMENLDVAFKEYESLLKTFPSHSLTDEIWFRLANIYVRTKDYPKAVSYLEKILSQYKEDILADNALFLLGELFQYKLLEKEKAMNYYKQILLEHPGSIFVTESRKRFRILRGDKL